jgi:hypothetical protein
LNTRRGGYAKSLCGRLPSKFWPELRIRNAAAQTRIVSGGWLWPGRRELSCYFKYMARGRIPEFESHHPSHAVVSSAVMTGQRRGENLLEVPHGELRHRLVSYRRRRRANKFFSSEPGQKFRTISSSFTSTRITSRPRSGPDRLTSPARDFSDRPTWSSGDRREYRKDLPQFLDRAVR